MKKSPRPVPVPVEPSMYDGKSKTFEVAFPMDKHDKTLFFEGVNVAGGIDVCVEKIARLVSLNAT